MAAGSLRTQEVEPAASAVLGRETVLDTSRLGVAEAAASVLASVAVLRRG